MHWNQIEDQWIAMTRRIRSDWKDGPRRPSVSGSGQARMSNPSDSIQSADDAGDTGSRHDRRPGSL